MTDKSKELYDLAQRQLVASLLYDSSESKRALEIVSYEDFEDPVMESIFYAIFQLSRTDSDINQYTVSQELARSNNLETIGGISAIYSLTSEGEEYATKSTIERLSSVVSEFATKNRIKKVLEENKDFLSLDSGVTASETISGMMSSFNTELISLSDNATTTDLSEYLENYNEILEDRKIKAEENKELANGLQGIPSWLDTLDKYTRGWQDSQLITVGARTGVGKSVFAVMSAVSAASAGKSVLFFSLEMGHASIVDRIVSCLSNVSLNNLKSGNIDEEDQENLDVALERFKDMKIKIDTDEKLTTDSIRARCDRQAQSEEGLDMVIIDYLQLITPKGKHGSRQEQVAEISRDMKLIAKSLGVPVMVLAQLKRSSGNESEEEDKLPKIDDIRESGSLGQDSDIVILLHREPSKDGSTPKTTVILAKNRDGESQKFIHCHSNLQYSRFDEIKTEDSIDNIDEEIEESAGDEGSDFEDFDFDDDDVSDFL